MKTYLTPVDAVRVHESGWFRIHRPGGRVIEVTCVPVIDVETALFARLDTRRATLAAKLFGARLVSRQTIRETTAIAIARGSCIEPVFLPNAKLMAIPPRLLGEPELTYQSRIRREMASLEWAKIHDLECWRRLEAARWDRESITANVGKLLQDGAPEGRCYIMGWWVDDHFVQAGTDSGPGPHAGGMIAANGTEIPGQHDYGTLTVFERDVLEAA